MRRIALTQFESTAARRAIPCWDEGALRSTFNINMISCAGRQPEKYARTHQGTLLGRNSIGCLIFNSTDADASFEWNIPRFETTPI
ncbi:hypothetical protein C8J57DRAFT_1322584 [Mycena rebaudengoi]|nr:hypothetical protein C8J57DRAFT_1322584 [Mycena rebaudengoi]